MKIYDELLERYKYLDDNKELILALCIKYDENDTKEDIKDKINNNKNKEKKLLKKLSKIEGKKDILTIQRIYNELLRLSLENQSYMQDYIYRKAYIYSNVDDEIVNAYEEFLLSDKVIENTTLYRHVEALKKDPKLLESVKEMIENVNERRKKENIDDYPAFTVWKILTYVRKKYESNEIVLKALDKYYNLERYSIANDDCEDGYNIQNYKFVVNGECDAKYPDEIFVRHMYCTSKALGRPNDNEFEEDDEFHHFNLNDCQIINNSFYNSRFANQLAQVEMIKDKNKALKKM